MKRFILLFLLWMNLSIAKQTSLENSPYVPLKIFAQSLNVIENHHPNSTSRKHLIEGAIQGMLFEMDPYSHFMKPTQLQDFQTQNQSQFGGIGVQVSFHNNQVMVTNVFKNSGAALKGIQPGDIITHVNNQSLQNLSFDIATEKISGKIGETIRLKIKRKNLNKPLSISVPLTRFKIPSLRSQSINKNLLYVKISSFRDNTFQEFKKSLKVKKCKKNQTPLCSQVKKGLLIDLRNNSGGPVDQALLIADLFISKGLLITAQGKNEQYNQEFSAKTWGTLNDFPIVILINKYTASASEVLVAALKENDRAFVVGEKSFGKGSLQTIFNLDEGYALKLTVAHYFTPQGHPIHEKGIQPHLVLNQNKELLPEELKIINDFQYRFFSSRKILHTPSPQQPLKQQTFTKKDSELIKAIQILHQLSQPTTPTNTSLTE